MEPSSDYEAVNMYVREKDQEDGYVEMYPPERHVGVLTPSIKTHHLILRSGLSRGNQVKMRSLG